MAKETDLEQSDPQMQCLLMFHQVLPNCVERCLGNGQRKPLLPIGLKATRLQPLDLNRQQVAGTVDGAYGLGVVRV